MKVLVTGASGFIGRNFLLRIPREWKIVALYNQDGTFEQFARSLSQSVIPFHCDLGNKDNINELVKKHGSEWEACLYLAAKVDIPWSVKDPKGDLFANVVPLLNLLEALHIGRFVYFSSGAVYDGARGEVTSRTDAQPTLPYAISKLCCERYVQFYHSRNRTLDRYLIARFFGAYGPYEAPHKIYTKLVQAFGIHHADSYTIYGDGSNLIDAMFVDDAIEAVYRMLTGSYWNATINLAAGKPVRIESLVRIAAETFGITDPHIRKEGIAHERNDFWSSAEDIRTHFGFEPHTALGPGLKHLYNFLARQ